MTKLEDLKEAFEQDSFIAIAVKHVVEILTPGAQRVIYILNWNRVFKNALLSPATAGMKPKDVIQFCHMLADELMKISKERADADLRLFAETKVKMEAKVKELKGEAARDSESSN